jgi:dihydrofolate reductase
MHDLPKYVLSSSLDNAGDWNNSHLLGAEPLSSLRALKEQEGQPLAVFAGGGAVVSALSMGLLDELRLVVHPSLVGRGTRLFDDHDRPSELGLTHVRQFRSGAVALNYEIMGPRG